MDQRVILRGFDFFHPGMDGIRESTISDLPGWWTTPATRHDDQELGAADGDAASDRHFESRMITINGDVTARDRDALFRFRDRVAGLMATPNAVKLDVRHMGGPNQTAQVVRVGDLQWAEKGPLAARWALTVKAPDPYKYGVTRRFPETGTVPAGTSIDVWHDGNVGSPPRITVTGYQPGGFTAFGTGSDRIRVTEGVNTGEVLLVDFATGHVFLNGKRKPTAATYRSLAEIPAYQARATNVISAQPELASNARYFVEVTDRWI